MSPRKPSDGYSNARSTMRVLGPVLAVLGGILVLIGFIALFGAATSIGNRPPGAGIPKAFILAFPGMLMLGIGLFMTKAGYLREVSQYAAKETSPAVRTTTTAVRSAWTDDDVPCPSCSSPVEPASKFCSSCGIQLTGGTCRVCQASVDSDDKFCAFCGSEVEL